MTKLLLEVNDKKERSNYYGKLVVQKPSYNTQMGAQQSMSYFANIGDDEFKRQLKERIEEYNAKYAGKIQKEVDRQERENIGKAPIILKEKYTPDLELNHIQLILTSESTYCGEHNTCDSGGCHVCKEHVGR